MKEIEAGRVVRPFKALNEFRLIYHSSYPKGSSVNDSIPDECSSVHYATISDAIHILKKLGAGSFLAKTDIKSAFRIIPVHPLEHSLLGIKWANVYYFDRCLAMGLGSSCAIFEKFSSSLEWLAMQHLHVSAVLHILDDFLFIAPSRVKCGEDLHKLLDMCNFLGVPMA